MSLELGRRIRGTRISFCFWLCFDVDPCVRPGILLHGGQYQRSYGEKDLLLAMEWTRSRFGLVRAGLHLYFGVLFLR
jgi:hypothetical protein